MRYWNRAKLNNANAPITELILDYNNIPKEEREMFLKGTLKDLPRMDKVLNADKFIERVEKAIDNKEKICFYGDYDVDGMTGSVVATLMVEELGGVSYIFTNDKKREGYGINPESLNRLQTLPEFEGTSLIITIDNGIAANDGIERAKEMGLEVIVTDHHEKTVENKAEIVVDLKQEGDDYPFRELCGCGVIWKLLRELFIRRGIGDEANKYLDLVALGTVVDMVPLLGENRIIVKEGLKVMNELKRPVFNAFHTFLAIDKFDENDLAFQIGPSLNSQTRIKGVTDTAIKALMTDDLNQASMLVLELIEVNKKRKDLLKSQEDLAFQLIEERKLYEDNVILLTDERFNSGVVGLVAGKVAKYYARPTIVGEIRGKMAICSARTYDNFDLFSLLYRNNELFLSFGGHRAAAGFSFLQDDYEKIRKMLLEDPEVRNYTPTKNINYLKSLKPEDVTFKLIKEIDALAPYGQQFTRPLFKIENIECYKESVDFIGQNKNHVKFKDKDLTVVGWGIRNHMEKISKDPVNTYSVIVNLSINSFRGRDSLQAIITEDNIVTNALRK